MLLHGDELGRTQGGNNNAYCQDNETSWVDWDRARDFEAFTEFTTRLVKLRRDIRCFAAVGSSKAGRFLERTWRTSHG